MARPPRPASRAVVVSSSDILRTWSLAGALGPRLRNGLAAGVFYTGIAAGEREESNRPNRDEHDEGVEAAADDIQDPMVVQVTGRCTHPEEETDGPEPNGPLLPG